MRRPARREARASTLAHDVETHSRLLESAGRLFAEHGLGKVTVRDICQDAEANVAAISYHFGDKLGLYLAVVDRALAAVRSVDDATMDVPAGATSEDRLRHYIHAYLPRIAQPVGRLERLHKLMRQEMAEPTPAVGVMVEQVITPRLRFLGEAVAELLACQPDDARVGQCVMSIQAQCLFYAPDRFKSAAFPGFPPTDAAALEAAADHITEFSLAGIRQLAARTAPAAAKRHGHGKRLRTSDRTERR